MTEQPLWRRQQAALAAEQDAPDPIPEADDRPAANSEYIRPDGSFVHIRDTYPDFPVPYSEFPPFPRESLKITIQGIPWEVSYPSVSDVLHSLAGIPPVADDPDTAEFSPAERKALRALLRERGLTT